MAKGKNGRSKDRTQELRLMSGKEAEQMMALAGVDKPVKSFLAQAQDKVQAADRRVQKIEQSIEDTRGYVKDQMTVDLVGSGSAVALTELMNLGARAVAEWSEKTAGEDGFFRNHIDFMQSIPGALGGLVYILDLALRPDVHPEDRNKDPKQQRPYMPPNWRRYMNEAAKQMSTLGLSNLLRALRFRWAESVDERVERQEKMDNLKELLDKANAEKEALVKRLTEVQRRPGGA